MNKKGWFALALCGAMLLASLTGCGSAQAKLLDPSHPTTVTVWNYYNGDQLSAFETLVNEFNDTVGMEEGIVVVSVSQGSINNLATALLDSVAGKAGAADIPSVASVYAETVYILNEQKIVTPLDSYFTADELSAYVPAFLDEGRLTENGELLLFPVSKSTEAFMANATDWASFAEATGITIDSVRTCEDLTAAAKAYYDWTDSLTPDVVGDGKALYGRDSVSNYIYIGAKQLGHEMFTVGDDGAVTIDMDRDTFRTLWDNYYIPYVNGWFGAFGSYRSEDLKTGSILAMTGSTSGVSYIPTAVTDANDNAHDIDVSIGKALSFADAVDPVAVQQGAGYCILKTDEAEQYASAEFLKWFTSPDRNLLFSIQSGYSPVTLAANNAEKIQAAFTVDSAKSQNMLNALLISADVYTTDKTYTCRAFEGSKDVRTLLDEALDKTAIADRAAVLEAVAAGKTPEEAVAPYETDEYFTAWFNTLCAVVEATVG